MFSSISGLFSGRVYMQSDHACAVQTHILHIFLTTISRPQKNKKSKWLRNLAEGICDTTWIRGELGGIWEPFGETKLAGVADRREIMGDQYFIVKTVFFLLSSLFVLALPGVLKVGVTKYCKLRRKMLRGSRDGNAPPDKAP